MARPVVALLTDFGERDHYAATLKGVVLEICQDVTLVDISHQIPPHDVQTAALELEAAYRYFPKGTIFLVVIDPGVGSTRRGLVAEIGEYRFVCPDNGVLTAVFRGVTSKNVVELTNRRYARAKMSRTFEGRDRFAPAAGWLARGIQLSAFGPCINNYETISIPVPDVLENSIVGTITRVDRFGNLVTNIDRRSFDRVVKSASVCIKVGTRINCQLVDTYADIPADAVCALFGSMDYLEIAANRTSAYARLGVGRSVRVVVQSQGCT